jgi:sortase A
VTTIASGSEGVDRMESHLTPDEDGALVERVRHNQLVRQFLARLGSVGGDRVGEWFTDEQWDSLWSSAREEGSDEQVVARVVTEAYRLHRSQQPPEPQWVTPDPGLVAPVTDLDVGTDAQQWPIGAAVTTTEAVPRPKPAPEPPRTGRHRRRTAAHRGASLRSRIGVIAITTRGGGSHSVSRRRHRGRPDATVAARRERWLTVASWVRNAGAIILLFVAWQLWGTAITQHHAQEALKREFTARVPHVTVKPPPGFSLVPATTRIPDPPQGTVMAQLQIPKINLSEYVVSGTDAADLAMGPGHYLGTAMPGQAGNVAIAGHRTTHGAPFNRLAEMAVGDPIYLTTLTGQRLTYIVSAAPVAVTPTDVTVLNNFGDDRLTLTTCNPEYSAAQRLVVVAAYEPPAAAKPLPIVKGTGTPYSLSPQPTSGWDMRLLPVVALEFAAVFILGLAYRRLSKAYGRDGRWLILVPIWLGILYVLFESLTGLLPASV